MCSTSMWYWKKLSSAAFLKSLRISIEAFWKFKTELRLKWRQKLCLLASTIDGGGDGIKRERLYLFAEKVLFLIVKCAFFCIMSLPGRLQQDYMSISGMSSHNKIKVGVFNWWISSESIHGMDSDDIHLYSLSNHSLKCYLWLWPGSSLG